MIIYSRVTEAPDQEPISLDEAKIYLKIDADDSTENALVTMLIKVARRLCENYSGLSFATQVRQIKLDSFPRWRNASLQGIRNTSFANWRRHDGMIVPYGPIQSIDSIKYVLDGDELILDPSEYNADISNNIGRLFPVDQWPDTDVIPNAVTIEYTAGYESVSGELFPDEAKVAMLQQIGSFYQNRQDETPDKVSKLDWASEKILDTIKVYWNANQD